MTSCASLSESLSPSIAAAERLDDGRVLTVAPSDLTFLLHECRRCFWLKIVQGRRRPPTPMPSVFTRLDRHQRDFFDGKPTSAVSPGLPPGRLRCQHLDVLSVPIAVAGHETMLRFRGAMDALIDFDDGTFGIVDFKTSSPSDASAVNYQLQLQAYALGIEQAELPERRYAPVTMMGLLCFDPGPIQPLKPGTLAFSTLATWREMKRDDASFLKFLGWVCEVLERPVAPLPSPNCAFCTWLRTEQTS